MNYFNKKICNANAPNSHTNNFYGHLSPIQYSVTYEKTNTYGDQFVPNIHMYIVIYIIYIRIHVGKYQ